MADTDLYSEARKSELTQLLAEQASLKSELEETEMEWFDYEEQMETLRANFE